MPLPVTTPQFASDLDTARAFLNAAAGESDPEKQRSLALVACAAAHIAQAEAVWLTGN